MKKILFFIVAISSCTYINAQVPTYKWVSGNNPSETADKEGELNITGPGPRQGSSSFTDSLGSLWMFGGKGLDIGKRDGYFNDLWKYDSKVKTWSWEGGEFLTDNTSFTNNRALSFNGTSDRIVLYEDPVNYTENFTAELWFKTEELFDDVTLFSLSPNDELNTSSGWRLTVDSEYVYLYQGVNLIIRAVDNSLTDSEWHHIAYSVKKSTSILNNGEVKLYIDGQQREITNYNLSDNLQNTDNHTNFIGYHQGNGEKVYFEGAIDEVRFWDYARSSGEIIGSYRREYTETAEGLTTYLNFNQGVIGSAGNTDTQVFDINNQPRGDLDFQRRGSSFVGEMANTRFWGRDLTSSEIVEAGKYAVVGTESDLLAAYNYMDGTPGADNTGSINLTDLSPNNLDGTLNSFSLNGNSSNFQLGKLKLLTDFVTANDISLQTIAADINNDTYEDIISRGYNSIVVYLNDQSGGLVLHNTIMAEETVGDISVTHLNDDSNLDIVYSVLKIDNTQDKLVTLTGDGTGEFAQLEEFSLGIQNFPYDVITTDLNNDGNQDVILLLNRTRILKFYHGDGTGNLTFIKDVQTNSLSSNLIMFEDVDNDGNKELITPILSGFAIYPNDGSGDFNSSNIYYETTDEAARSSFMADINNDGNLDIVFASIGFINTMLGRGDGTFENNVKRPFEFNQNTLSALGENDQGNFEVMVSRIYDPANINVNRLYVLELLPGGDINEKGSVTIRSNFEASEIAVADFDKNGFNDIAAGSNNSGINVLYRSDNSINQPGSVSSLNFDGVDDQVKISDLKPYDGSFTWESWIKTVDNGVLFSYLPEDDNYAWGGFSNGFAFAIKDERLTLIFESGSEIFFNPYDVNDNSWHHVALSVTFNDQIIIYIDGQPAGRASTELASRINLSNTSYITKLGYATSDFHGLIGVTGLESGSNWIEGVDLEPDNSGRAFAGSWAINNDLFIFGGEGKSGLHNSIKKFNENEGWTLVNGTDLANSPGEYGELNISSPLNLPPARKDVQMAVDGAGNIWMYGGALNTDSDTPIRSGDLWMYDPEINEWTWKSGSENVNESPVYGVRGISDEINTPGARDGSLLWYEDGYLWLFGGERFYTRDSVGYLNDLWRFNLGTNEWTWINGSNNVNQGGVYGDLGVSAASNYPGSRSKGIVWNDGNGKTWLFGGFGYDKFGVATGYMNDLWSYDHQNGRWTWLSGSDFANSSGSYNELGFSSSENVPGARFQSTAWIDKSSNLWLYGGFLRASQSSTGLYNDFWNYSTNTTEWTWRSGVSTSANLEVLGSYGNLGEGSVPHPGARHGALHWSDEAGNFWMQGGSLFGTARFGLLNDLWKYEAEKGLWSYFGGATESEISNGSYGARGVGSTDNIPRGRWHGYNWMGNDGKLWFFGGLSYDQTAASISWLNDLWVYDPDSKVYTWIAGETDFDASGTYGSKGVASVSNIPGARGAGVSWTDEEGNFWLFGGYQSFEYNNDLWKFNPSTLEWTWLNGNSFRNTPGTYGELGVADQENVIGSRRYSDAWVAKDGKVWLFGGQGVDSEAQLGSLNDLWLYDPETNIWTWMGGSNKKDDLGNYGEIGVPHPDNLPPSRYAHSTWLDDSGNLWLFGGFGLKEIAGQIQNVYLDDLWKYNTQTNLWAWIGGSKSASASAVVATEGVFSENHVISGRQRMQKFNTYDKSLWFFGGRASSFDTFGDLWEIKFTPGMARVSKPAQESASGFKFLYEEPWSTDYIVQASIEKSFAVPFLEASVTENEFEINELESATRYYYRVNSVNEIGQSGFSEPDSVLTLPDPPQFESSETALQFTDSQSLVLSWLSASGIIDNYSLEISRDSIFIKEEFIHSSYDNKLLDNNVNQEQVTELLPGTEYFIRMQSLNATGKSIYSDTIKFLTRPASPVQFDISDVTDNSASISWIPVREILDGYQVEVSSDVSFHPDSILTGYNFIRLEKNILRIDLIDLEIGSNYFIRVYSENSAGLSVPSEIQTVLTKPESPLFDDNALLSADQEGVEFQWLVPSEIYDGFLLEISEEDNFDNQLILLPGYGKNRIPKNIPKGQLSEKVTGLSPGERYFARIRSYNSSGVSSASNTLEFETIPMSPGNIDVTFIKSNSAVLRWVENSAVAEYLIDISLSRTFQEDSVLLDNFPLSEPFYSALDLNSGTKYYARVQTANSSGRSGDFDDFSNTEFVTLPGRVTFSQPDNYTENTLDLNWSNVNGASGYVLDVSDNFFQTFVNGFRNLEISTNNVTVNGLTPGSIYQARVRARNSSGFSAYDTLLDIRTLTSAPIARDASDVSSRVFTANWDPVNGATYYLLEVTTDNFESFFQRDSLFAASPLQLKNLTAGTTYTYRVLAGNQSGKSTPSNVITVIAQNNAQSFNIGSIEFEEKFPEGIPSTELVVNLTGGAGKPTVGLIYKGISSANYSDTVQLAELSENKYGFTFLESMFDEIGLEFSVFADDEVTLVTSETLKIKRSFSESQSENFPELIASNWQIISIPYILDNDQVTAIFNELSSLEYKKDWRLLTFKDDAYLDALSDFNNIELGKGYWFLSLEERSINIGAGEANVDVPYKMALTRGWNQIGNPFNKQVNWDEVLRASNLSSIIENLNLYDNQVKSFRSGSILEPFSGAFVWSNDDVVVDVFPAANNFNGRQEVSEIDDLNAAENWFLPIEFTVEGKNKTLSGVGMNISAGSEKDSFDKLVPPRFLSYTEMFTYRDDFIYPYFSRDIVPVTDHHVWSFELASNSDADNASLSWDIDLVADRTNEFWLVDEDNGRIVDMTSISQYDFKFSEKHAISIHYSENDGYKPIPSKLVLGDAYPNPVLNTTKIPVLLPESENDYNMKLLVYDLQGKKVATLANGKYGAGLHVFDWSPNSQNPLPAGLYIYRLVFEDSSLGIFQKKVLYKN